MFSKFILWLFPPRDSMHAATLKRRFAMAYGFLGWNSFMFFFYTLYTKKMPTDVEGQKYVLATKLGKYDQVHMIRMENFRLVENKTEEVKNLKNPRDSREALETIDNSED